jgi:hypothetical protein
MDLSLIEFQLRKYQVMAQTLAEADSLPDLVDGKFCARLNGQLEEIDIKTELQWIDAQRAPLEEAYIWALGQWNKLAPIKDPSSEVFKNQAHHIQKVEEKLGKVREVFLLWKHSPKLHETGYATSPSLVAALSAIAQTLEGLKENEKLIPSLFDPLSEVQKLRIAALAYIKKTHGDLRLTVRTLYKAPPGIKDEIRSFLYTILGNDPNARGKIEEVLRKPKKKKRASDPFDSRG